MILDTESNKNVENELIMEALGSHVRLNNANSL